MNVVLWVDERPEQSEALRRSGADGTTWASHVVSGLDGDADAMKAPYACVVVVRTEDGVWALSRLRERWPRVPRLAVLATEDPRLLVRAVNEGRACSLLLPDATGDELRRVLEGEPSREQAGAGFRSTFFDSLVEERVKLISRAKREWELTFDALAVPVALVDSTGRVVRANRATARAAALDVRELPGQPYAAVLYGLAAVPGTCPIARVLAGEDEAEAELSASEGRVLSVRAFRGSAPDLAVCTVEDVTQEKVQLRSSLHTEKMVALGQLAGGVAHEINNPLATILAFSNLLKTDPGRSAEDQEALEAIEQSAQRCRRIVDNMLRFSRRETARQVVDLSAVVREAAALFQIQAKQYPQAEFQLELSEGLPQLSLNVGQFEQVLLNLLQNALQALPRRAGRISVATRAEGARLVLEVRDTGIGIAPEVLARVFDAGFTTKEEGEGTGLGLTIVRSIVKEHGGKVSMESRVGEGTLVSIQLPTPLHARRGVDA